MALKRNVGLKGLKYKGGGPMLAFVLHRLGGLAMVFLVGMHIKVTFLSQSIDSEWPVTINRLYQSIYVQIILYFLVLFHALNGLRIILLDIWPQALEYQRHLIWLQWLILLPVYGLTVFIMIQRTLGGG